MEGPIPALAIALTFALVLAAGPASAGDTRLTPGRSLGTVEREQAPTPIPGATWLTGKAVEDGLEYTFPAGTLSKANWIWADMLLDGDDLAVFELRLQETGNGPVFKHDFALLNQCAARVALPLEAVLQNRWQYPRRGAYMKPLCFGDRVDVAKVDRMTLTVLRKGPRPVRWCVTPFSASVTEPPRLTNPALPKGKLLDEMGQSRTYDWPGKSRSVAEVTDRLKRQLAAAPSAGWPAGFSRWGGCARLRFKATGFFRTHHDGRRWWLVDPDGCAFFSTGPDIVTPDVFAHYEGLETALTWLPPAGDPTFKSALGKSSLAVNYLGTNLIRAFGPDRWRDDWAALTLGQLKDLRFNTVGNWSDWKYASAAKFPYVRHLDMPATFKTAKAFRDFPDVFAPTFAEDAAAFAEQLRPTKDDPALIGYFLMNEPTWGFTGERPAAGMLFTTDACASRTALAEHLRGQYGSDEKLRTAWAMPAVSLAKVAAGRWSPADPGLKLTDAAKRDLEAFSTVMADRLFRTLGEACSKVDPNHLNLGARYHTVPPLWAQRAMTSFDVFSVNGYDHKVRAEDLGKASTVVGKPVLIGEWHFGALDVGTPAPGICHVSNQADRGRAYRVYLEHAAKQTWCVGAHYFQLYDQSALGRGDGENCNIGFFDVCNRRYEDLAQAARATHERMYRVADGSEKPYDDAPEYLPRLFN